MSVSFHRSRAGFQWRSCKARLGPVRFMTTVALDWVALGVYTPLGFLMVQRGPSRTVVHGRLT